MARTRVSTSTANFGSGRREAHDASAFYDRFVAPEISTDTTVNPPAEVDVIYEADARSMDKVADNSVALVVTSPPYFAGKQYEEDLGVNGVPADYLEYLELLRDVFAECKRVLEPGGRIAVNVANLGRRPYRSLSGDVTAILQDLGLLLRGEVVWWKGRAAGGSCAWGTFQRPSNPVLRDVTERIVIASKGRFDRALTPAQRLADDLPSTATISREEFMEATTDLWEIPPERATRVGHPAPFPVELPLRAIELYTYVDDVVLDPFMGSGSTAVAAVRSGRRFVGFDMDPNYIEIANRRVDEERERIEVSAEGGVGSDVHVELRADDFRGPVDDSLETAIRDGRQVRDLAEIVLRDAGFSDIRVDVKPRGLGITLSLVAADAGGRDWAFDVTGALTTVRGGLRRTDNLWKSLATAAVLHAGQTAGGDGGDGSGGGDAMPLVLMTTDVPKKGSAGWRALQTVMGEGRAVFDVVEVLNPEHHERLATYARASSFSDNQWS